MENLIFDAIRHLCPDHNVVVGSSALDAGDPEARTVWQRISVKCAAPLTTSSSSKNGKLLDLTEFCEKMLVPLIVSGKPKREAVSLKHKNGNNSWLNFIFGLNNDVGAGYLSRVQFKVKGTQRKVLRTMLEVELRSFHLHKIALVTLGSSAATAWLNNHQKLVARERAQVFQLLSMDSFGRPKRGTHTLYEIRNAIRRRLRARRIREKVRLGKSKRKRSAGGLEKHHENKLKVWQKNISKIDSAEDLGKVLGFVVSYCPTSLANKVLEIETDHVSGVKPAWADNFYKYAEIAKTSLAAKDDDGVVAANTKILLKWLEAIY